MGQEQGVTNAPSACQVAALVSSASRPGDINAGRGVPFDARGRCSRAPERVYTTANVGLTIENFKILNQNTNSGKTKDVYGV
jgi:hypothetical protein